MVTLKLFDHLFTIYVETSQSLNIVDVRPFWRFQKEDFVVNQKLICNHFLLDASKVLNLTRFTCYLRYMC